MSYPNYQMMGMSANSAPVAALTPTFASQPSASQHQQQPPLQQQFNTNSQMQQQQQQQQQRMMMQQMQMRRPYPDGSYAASPYSVPNPTPTNSNNSNPNPSQTMNAYAAMQTNMGPQYANNNNSPAPNQLQSYQSTPSLPYSNMSLLNDPFRSSGGVVASASNNNVMNTNPNLLAVNASSMNGNNTPSPMSLALVGGGPSGIDPLTGRRRSIASFSPLPGGVVVMAGPGSNYNSNPSTPSDVGGLTGGTGSRRASIVEFPQPMGMRPGTLVGPPGGAYPALITPAAAATVVAANTFMPSPSKPPPMNFTSTANINGNGALATPLATRLTPSLAMASAHHPTAALNYSASSIDASNGGNNTDILAAATVVAGVPAATKAAKSALSLNSPLADTTFATATVSPAAAKTAKVSPAPILTKSSPRPTTSSKSNSNKKSTTPSPSPPPVASPSSAGTPRSLQSASSKGGKNISATPSPPAVNATLGAGGKKPAKPRSKPPSCAPNAEELPPGFKKQACTVCHHAKTSCDGRRPCFRCIRLNKTAMCEDRQRKEHLKKKSPPRTSPSQSSKSSAGKKGSTPSAPHRTTATSASRANKRKRAAESDEEDAEDDEEEQEDVEMEDEEEADDGEEDEEVEEGEEEAEADHSHDDGEGHEHDEAEAEGEEGEAEADDESDEGQAAPTGPAATTTTKSADIATKAKEGGGKVSAPAALVSAVVARSAQMSDGALPIPTSETNSIPIPTSSLPIPVTPNQDGAAADTASLMSDVTAGMPSNPYISRYMRRRSSTLEGLAASSYLNAGTDAYGGSLARVGGELRSAMVSPSSFLANRRDSLAGGLGFIGSGSLLMNSHAFTPMSPMSIVERTIQSQPMADPSMDHMLSYTVTDESGAPLSGSASSSLPHHPVVLPMDSAASHHLLMGRRRSSIGAPLHLGLFAPNVPGTLAAPGSSLTNLPPRVPGSLGFYPSPAGSVAPSPNFLAPPVTGLASTAAPSTTPVASPVPVGAQPASALEGLAAASNASAAPLPSAFLSGKERLSKSLMASYRSIDVRSKIKEKLEAILKEKEQEIPTSAESAAVNKLVVGRLQFYLLQLSELMQEDDWNELVDELPIQVFTSQSARYVSPPPQARKIKSTDSKSETSEESVPPSTTSTTAASATVPAVATPDSSVVPSSRKSSVSSASNVSYNYPYGSQCKVSWFESPVLCMEEDDAALVREVRLRRLMKKNLAEGITNPESVDADLKALMAGSLQTGPSPSEVDVNASSVAIMKIQPLSVYRAMKRAQRRAHRLRGASRRSSVVPTATGSAATVDPSDVSAVENARRVQRRLRKREKKRAKKQVRREKRKQKQAERKKRKAEKKAKARAAKKLKTVDANGVPVSVKVEPESDSDFEDSSSSDFSSSSSSSSSCSSSAELSSDYSDTDDEDLGGESAAFSASASNPAAAAFNGWLPVRLEKHQATCKVFLAQRAAAREARRKKRAEAKGGVAAANTTNPAVLSTMSPMSDGNPSATNPNNASAGATSNPAPSADVKCSCVPSLHLPMIVHVNREWERLFGWTQREIRTLMLRDGLRGLGRVTRLDAFTTAHKHIFEAILSGASDYRCYATIINKWQCAIPCMAHTRIELSDMDGCFQGYVNTWTPLPQATQAAE